MEDNKNLKSLRDLVEKELAAFTTKNTLNPSDVETAKNAVCLIKEINEVLRQSEGHDETSEAYRMMHSSGCYPMYSYGEPGRMYHDGYSDARGRDAATGRYVSRGYDYDMDTSGRRYTFSYDTSHHVPYDETSGRRMSGRHYSYDKGYSGHSIDDRIVDMLEKMMDDAVSNYERNKINSIIRVVDSMRGE